MTRQREEPNYLVRTQLVQEPKSFKAAVLQAFRDEHVIRWQKDIAEIADVDEGLLSNWLKEPWKMNVQTVGNLLSHIKSNEHKRKIIRAWIKASLGFDVLPVEFRTLIEEHVTPKTVRRVKRQVAVSQFSAAASTSLAGARKAKDPVLRDMLLDDAFYSRLRLDLVGHAMSIARAIAEYAVERNDRHRLATGHYFRARALMQLPDITPVEIEHALEPVEVINVLQPLGEMPYLIITPERVDKFRIGATVSFMERGVVPVDKSKLRRILSGLILAAPKNSREYKHLFENNFFAARIYLLLGERTNAEDRLEVAYYSDKKSVIHPNERCGLTYGRILREHDSSAAADFFRKLAHLCIISEDRYDGRVAQFELARLEGKLFPPSHPVL